MTDMLKLMLAKGEYLLTMVRKSVLSIRVKVMEKFVKVRPALVQRDNRFDTHTPKAFLPYTLCVDGLYGNFGTAKSADFFRSVDYRVDLLSLVRLTLIAFIGRRLCLIVRLSFVEQGAFCDSMLQLPAIWACCI